MAAARPRERLINDPEPITPYQVVFKSRLLQLRRYSQGRDPGPSPSPSADANPRPSPAVLVVYSLYKRPYVLDLLPERSIVRTLMQHGFTVYLTDWLPPRPQDAAAGFARYIDRELANAVDYIRMRECADRVPLVGCCLGALLAVAFSARYPGKVERLVPFALPLRTVAPVAPAAAEALVSTFGNVPAWWIRVGMNGRVANSARLPSYLADQLGEPDIADCAHRGSVAPVQLALERWFASDVPLAGQLFRESVYDAYLNAGCIRGGIVVGGRRIEFSRVRCPVLSVSAERDELVPLTEGEHFIRQLGVRDKRHLVFPSGHLGLMVSRAAHVALWPRIARWLLGEGDGPTVTQTRLVAVT